jgi:pectin methylesterase-like acyl-CoA thioesterase
MPAAEVAAVLKTARHRNTALTWTSNDMFDIDALTVAVPYCDIVGADNAQAHALTVTRLADRMGTVIMRSVTELPAYL